MATRGASLKMVKEIRVAFDPFVNSSSVPVAREFVRRVSSPRLADTNPKFKLTSTIKCDGKEPLIEVTFIDKEVRLFSATDTRFHDVYAQFIRDCKAKETGS